MRKCIICNKKIMHTKDNGLSFYKTKKNICSECLYAITEWWDSLPKDVDKLDAFERDESFNEFLKRNNIKEIS